ncbi:hypothetical protein [Epilithonimonas hispanica]|nr:hypothetical protein [Epilithonimonas hispanica]
MSFLGGMHNEKSIIKAKVEEDTEILFLIALMKTEILVLPKHKIIQ